MDSITHEAEHGDETALEETTAGGLMNDEVVRGVATVGAIGVAVALIEVALIPGMVIGVAAALAPKYVPKFAESMEPMFRSTVRGLYKFNRKARETVAEAHEKVLDIVAEVHTEEAAAPAEKTPLAQA